jgi:ABC-type Fe3+/spermidine/putrescine transport system ATPase subunit
MIETREILDQGGVTALVVTHDQEEAEALSDRLALMRDGTIVQSGTLDDLRANPADAWVKEFLG